VSAYNLIASRNVFSPTRSETPVTATPGALVGGTKPNLQGVVLRDANTNAVAYLEDPLTKRVAGYRIGDSIAGGRVETITADHVIIARPDGNIDVRLRDPSKPRPAPPAVPPALPGQLPVPGAPSVVPPTTSQPMPQPSPIQPRVQTPQQPSPPFQGPPVNPLIPSRRLSPSLGNRLPLPSASEGIQQPPQPQQ
jgi:hypothetical protein